MKKLALLFVCMLTLISCDIDDNSPVLIQSFAVVSETNLPDFFEKHEVYVIEVTYLLPTACHQATGLQVQRGSQIGSERRDIYIAGVTGINSNVQECSVEGADLEKKSSFELLIDEEEAYTFYLWTGIDDNQEHQYTTITIPVGDPEEEDFEDQ